MGHDSWFKRGTGQLGPQDGLQTMTCSTASTQCATQNLASTKAAQGTGAASFTLKAAKEQAGEVSTRNSKMPGSSFAISAKHCQVGGKLAQVAGSTCSRCYALKLQKMRPSVDMGWTNNYLKATRLITENPAQWARAIVFQINKAAEKTGERFHRWFDFGRPAVCGHVARHCHGCRVTP